MTPQEETKRALIVVRTYPVPSRSGVEVSCTAAITDKGEWLRLFPVPWRLLDEDKQFRKYQWVDVTVTKARDSRPESFKLSPDGLKIVTEPLSTAKGWSARNEFRCDDKSCRGHTIICTGWEMGESYRKWRLLYGDEGWEEKFRQRYETEMIQQYDTHFYMGTIHGHPHVWIIVGLFYPPYPPNEAQGDLF